VQKVVSLLCSRPKATIYVFSPVSTTLKALKATYLKSQKSGF
jgi:hypothetical protein